VVEDVMDRQGRDISDNKVGETRSSGKIPSIWGYTDYRTWLKDSFQARKATHSWYSYGVLAQKAGFQARDYLLRVMKGERGLSVEGAERLAEVFDLRSDEKQYLLALVEYNQARRDDSRALAWSKVQHAQIRSGNGAAPRMLVAAHRRVLSGWQHLAVRSFLEMRPDPGDWEALGRKLWPRRSATSVRRSIGLLRECGLVERRDDGLWHATDKSITAPTEIARTAGRKFHRSCLKLATASLETVPSHRRNVSGVMLGISREVYEEVCRRIDAFREELVVLAETDHKADKVYQLTLSLFPLSDLKSWEDASR
jgi:uncharacterized protein (TIGR02147 family)